MLEEQQALLVSGLQQMYRQLQSARVCSVPAFEEVNGNPLTHDILASMSLWNTTSTPISRQKDLQEIETDLVTNGETSASSLLNQDRHCWSTSHLDYAVRFEVPITPAPSPVIRIRPRHGQLLSSSPEPLCHYSSHKSADVEPCNLTRATANVDKPNTLDELWLSEPISIFEPTVDDELDDLVLLKAIDDDLQRLFGTDPVTTSPPTTTTSSMSDCQAQDMYFGDWHSVDPMEINSVRHINGM